MIEPGNLDQIRAAIKCLEMVLMHALVEVRDERHQHVLITASELLDECVEYLRTLPAQED